MHQHVTFYFQNPNFNPPGEKDEGGWLCADGPYLNRIRASCNLQPALRLPDPRNHAIDLRDRPARVALFSFPQTVDPQRSDFGGEKGPEELGLHFKSNNFVYGKQIRNVYLLESLNPEYVAVFGDAIKIDPRFFVDHERILGNYVLPFEPSIATGLLSLLRQSRPLMMESHELRNPDRQVQSFNLSCAESGRDLWIIRLVMRPLFKSVSSIMLRLDISLEAPNNSNARDTTCTESDSDFQYIHTELKCLVERAIFLNESLTGLTGIVGNRQALAEARRSIREAKSVKSLTVVGMIFIPLAFTIGMFSMANWYLENFRTFFAVSIPLVL